MNHQRLTEILERIPSLRVLVVGDFFLDKYLHLERALSEISLETDLEAYQVTAVRVSPGAAGTVVNNLVALGARVAALGVIGDTGEGYEFRRALDAMGVDHSRMILRPELLMPTYTKPMMYERDGSIHELERLDIKNRALLASDIAEEFGSRLESAVARADVIIISEYLAANDGGVITDTVRAQLTSLARAHLQKFFLVDSRLSNAQYAYIIVKCNLREALHALDRAYVADLSLSQAQETARALEKRTDKPVFLTLGERGIVVCIQGQCSHLPAPVEPGPVDTVGAGDSVMAGVACALGVGASYVEAALLGNLVAAVTIKKIGTTGTARPAEVLEKFQMWERLGR